VFIVDASGSMRKNRRMVETKTAVLSLLMSAYTSRDRVALVAFRGASAQVVLPFTSSVDRARLLLERLPAGGRTPLAEGLRQGLALALEERRRRPRSSPLLVVLSDGKPNWGRRGEPVAEAEQVACCIRRARLPLLFLDTDPTWQEPGMGQSITRITHGRYLALADLSAEAILRAVSLRDAIPGFLER
jgi:magnesium chelatase subunit D